MQGSFGRGRGAPLRLYLQALLTWSSVADEVRDLTRSLLGQLSVYLVAGTTCSSWHLKRAQQIRSSKAEGLSAANVKSRQKSEQTGRVDT